MRESRRHARRPLWMTLGVVVLVGLGASVGGAQTPDTTPPETTITFGPAGPSGADWAAFEFTSSESGSSFGCSVDVGAFVGCTSPKGVYDLPDGEHTFRVRATDAAGNTDPTPAARTWTIDTVPPDTQLTSGPSSPTQSDDATLTFVGSEPGTTFACSLDGPPFVACTSPQSYERLFDGSHTFRVQALDVARNADPTPAEWKWTVDARGPDLAVERPTSGVYVNDQSVIGIGSPPIVVGSVTVEVRATDGQSGVASITFDINDVVVDPSKVSFQNGVYRFTFVPPSLGEHSIGIRATNGGGLTESMRIRVLGVPTA